MAVKKQKTSSSKPSRATSRGAAKPSQSSSGRKGKSAKKRPARKNGTGSYRAALVVAFVAGLVVATFFLWNLRDGRHNGVPSAGMLRAIKTPSANKTDKLAAIESGSVVRGRTREGLPPVERTRSQALEKNSSLTVLKNGASTLENIAVAAPQTSAEQSLVDEAPGLSDAGQRLSGTSQPTGSPGQGEGASLGLGVEQRGRAVTDPRLPYEESLGAPLDERIRQVDYALMQAAWSQKLSAAGIRLASVENRLEGVEPYHFQTVDILPGTSAKAYLAALREALKAWAGKASLIRINDNIWAISLERVRTHVLRFYPGKSSFPDITGELSENLPHRAHGQAARMVIVIDDLGAGMDPVHQLLALDFPVTFAFWPYGSHTQEATEAAYRANREIIIHQPMEPLGYPKIQPGPGTLRVGMPEERIRAQLEENIAKVPHAVGLNNHMGSRFTQNVEGVDVVIDVLRNKGLFMLDSVTHQRSVFYKEARRMGLEAYQRQVFLDVEATRSNVLAQLRRAEHIALLTGESIAIGHPLPATLGALVEWQRLRDPNVQLVFLRGLR